MSKLDLLGTFKFEEEWKAKDLASMIIAGLREIDTSKYKRFYMKIYGYFDPRLCDDNRFFGLMGIDNKYRKMFQDFNFNMMIKQETDTVLIIESERKDFARYEAVCAFKENNERGEDEVSRVLIYGEYSPGLKGLFKRG